MRSPSIALAVTLALTALSPSVPVNAQAIADGHGSLTCTPPFASCTDPAGTGNAIFGDYGYYASSHIVSLNTEPGWTLGSSVIVGTDNSLTAYYSRNTIVGAGNTANGLLGNLGIYGYDNNIQSDNSNVSVVGSGNVVTGTQDGNWGLSIVGGSNQVNASSGTIAGTSNTVDSMTRGTVTGYQNSVTNAADTEVVGNGNTVSGDRTVTVGNGNSNTAAEGVVVGNGSTNEVQGGVVLGNGAGLGADATNSVALGNGTYTDRADTVDVGGRTISNVAPGILPTDAVNLAQMQAGDARTLMQANAYTDQVFSRVERKINAAGAAASAMGIMAGTAAGNAQSGLNRVAMGVANYNGQSAIAMGYQRTIRDRISLTLGASFSGSERVVGAGVSFGW